MAGAPWVGAMRARWRLALLAVALLAGACQLSQQAFRWSPPDPRGALREVVPLGALGEELPESSGLAPAAREPGVYWTHNDSGNDPLLFAITDAGRTVARVRVPGSALDEGDADWEALGAGPCPRGDCLVVGDVGDNFARRPQVRLLRVPEPALGDTVVREVDVLAVRYPDGPRDVEALYVAPDTSVWLVTKRPAWRAPRGRPARLYRVPAAAWRDTAPVVAEFAGTLPVVPGRRNAREWITDAALSPLRPDGTRLLAVLTYGTVHLFRADPVTGRPGARVGRCPLPIPEHDAEAVAWRPDGTLLLTNEGEGSTVYAGRCP